jgi:release factor glutamine methyltransferase
MQQLLQYIREQLEGYYPSSEIRSLGYRILESLYQADRQTLLRGKDKQLSANDLAQIRKITEELKKFRPLQYILGETEFYGLPFYVNEHVLIPRPETEELVEWVLQGAECRVQGARCRILDVGTGSGCIAIALAKHLPEAEVYALDISEKALEVAEGNACLNKVNFVYRALCTQHHPFLFRYHCEQSPLRYTFGKTRDVAQCIGV